VLPLRLLRLARAAGVESAPELLALAVLAGFSGPRQAERVLKAAVMIAGATIAGKFTAIAICWVEVDPPESSLGLPCRERGSGRASHQWVCRCKRGTGNTFASAGRAA
jgi:hypothetical protein